MASGRVPPHDLEAEEAVLGSMMLSPTACKDVLSLLAPEDFYRIAHETIFRAIRFLARSGPVDVVLVNAELMRRRLLNDVGGGPYLATLVQSVPTASNARYYANVVKEHSQRRRLIDWYAGQMQRAYDLEDANMLLREGQIFFAQGS